MIEHLRQDLLVSVIRLVGVAAFTALTVGGATAQRPNSNSQVIAQGSSFSGPSIAHLAETVTFHGGALRANAALTVVVTSPDGNAAGYGTVASPRGRMDFTFTPAQLGAHTLELTTSGGRALAKVVINVLP